LVFVDESGLLMAPLVRRSWAPRGNTPILYQRTRFHQKVSIIAGLCVNPSTGRIHLYFRLHPDENIKADSVIGFLRQLLRQLDGPVILIWDRLMAHRAQKVKRFIDQRPEIQCFFLPPYAPELNPVEDVWGYLKMNPLANYAPSDVDSLAICTRRHARSVQRRHRLLHAFLKRSPLFFHRV
jgi:transposase